MLQPDNAPQASRPVNMPARHKKKVHLKGTISEYTRCLDEIMDGAIATPHIT